MRQERLFNIKIIIHVLGSLLLFEAGFMLIAVAVSFSYGEPDFVPLLLSFVITLSTAVVSYFAFRKENLQEIEKREAYSIVTFIWIVFSLFGSLPFFISGYIPEYTDAFFETISGFTTTGATILDDVEALPHGLLFWRSMIQWIGGMGIIVFFLAVLPIFGIGGIHLYGAEMPGPIKNKLRPRIAQTAKILWGIYTALTLMETVLLYIGGMSLFDAVCQSFCTMSTGGYSTKNASIAHWNSPFIEYVITFFMMIAGMNYAVIYLTIIGKFKKLYRNEELRFYLLFGFGFSFIIMTGLLFTEGLNLEPAFRTSVFQVFSMMTGTGYITVDYMFWIPFLWSLLLFIMIIGGCAGSAAGGVKAVRVAVLFKNSYYEFRRLLHPNAVIPVKFNRKVLPAQIVTNVLAFVVLYALIVIVSILILTLFGIDFVDSTGATVSCMSNVGPAIGTIGSSGNFSQYPDIVKWYMGFLMLVGRLEIFTILSLLFPSFWKK